MQRRLRNHGLSIVLLSLFLITFLCGQLICGWKTNNEDRKDHGESALTLGAYFGSPHFLEATTENWESEFLEMFVYVWITTFLFQRGSAESKDPDEKVGGPKVTAQSPWPVRRGGMWRRVYSHSLSLAFALLFVTAFTLHLCASTALENSERARRGEPPLSKVEHLGGPKFWFQSFQNWQSEFLAISCMVIFSIYLREKNSPESKPVEASHRATGA